jgi:predicted Zn-dependent peptidase
LRSLDLEVRTIELPNGLAVAIAPLPHLHTVSLVVGVRVGSRYETGATNGISHFLEHMLFRGTAQHPTAYEFNLAVEELGGTLEAATGSDVTTYQLTLPPEHLEHGLAVTAEIFGEPTFRHVELEKRIIREEILESLDEDGREVDADDLAHRALFGSHPLGLKIAGTEATLARFGEADLRAWHARYYVARNASLAIAGAVDPTHAEALARRCFMPLREGTRHDPPAYTGAMRGPRWSYVASTGSQTEVRIALPSFGEHHPRKIAMELLARVLDDGMSSRLFRTIIEDTGLAYEAFGVFEPYEDVGILLVGAAIEHSKTAELVRTMLDLLAGLRDAPITERELRKVKTRALFDLRAMLDDSAAVAEMLAIHRLFGIDDSIAEIASRIEATTVDEIAAAARETIRPDHLQVVAVGALSDALERETRRIVQAFR